MEANRHPGMARESVPVYNPAGRQVGSIEPALDGRLTLTKRHVIPSKHMMHKYRGWALDAAHLRLCVLHGVERVHILTDDGREWRSELSDWLAHGVQLVAAGHGVQVVLPGPFWTTNHPDSGRQLALLPEAS